MYKITKVETFTEMGISMFEKETDGKFIKVYMDLTNNAKETKEIFTTRFKIGRYPTPITRYSFVF